MHEEVGIDVGLDALEGEPSGRAAGWKGTFLLLVCLLSLVAGAVLASARLSSPDPSAALPLAARRAALEEVAFPEGTLLAQECPASAATLASAGQLLFVRESVTPASHFGTAAGHRSTPVAARLHPACAGRAGGAAPAAPSRQSVLCVYRI